MKFKQMEVNALGPVFLDGKVTISYWDDEDDMNEKNKLREDWYIPFKQQFAELRLGSYTYKYAVQQGLEYTELYLGMELMKEYKDHPELWKHIASIDMSWIVPLGDKDSTYGKCVSCAKFGNVVRDGNHRCNNFVRMNLLNSDTMDSERYPWAICRDWKPKVVKE